MVITGAGIPVNRHLVKGNRRHGNRRERKDRQKKPVQLGPEDILLGFK